MKKRLICLLLTLAMLAGLVPTVALAATDPASVKLYIAPNAANGKYFRCLVRSNGALIDDVTNVAKVRAGASAVLGPVRLTLSSGDCIHSYRAKVTAPTCTEPGCTTYTCALCGDTYQADELPALGHDYRAVGAAPTCTEPGCTTYTCALCGDTYQADEVPAPGHDYKVTMTAPTCLTSGYTTYTCALCGDTYQANEVSALGHDYKDSLCTRCGAEDPAYDPLAWFTDLKNVGWAREGIAYCVRRGLMKGTSTTRFDPTGYVTRAQLVTILYRIEGEPALEYEGTFTDVAKGKWYTAAIEWAAACGIVNGIGQNRFDPDGRITREQIAAILYRRQGSPEVSGDLSIYPDGASVSTYAVDALRWATRQQLINGIADGGITRLAPRELATRAQIAAIIMRYLDESPGQSDPELPLITMKTIVKKGDYGVDVSEWQPKDIDWVLAKASGVKFAFLRCGYGMHGVDSNFAHYYQQARAAEIPVGTYFFSYAMNADEAAMEAEHCLQILNGRAMDLPVVFDIEERNAPYSIGNLSKKQITDMVVAFCERIEAAGYTPMIYSNYYLLLNKLDFARVKDYQIWMAHYSETTDFPQRYEWWQFTSQGRIPGMGNGNIDRNVAMCDYTIAVRTWPVGVLGASDK